MSPTKKKNSKAFQFAEIGSTRLSVPLEGLNSSPAQPAGKFWWCKIMQKTGSNYKYLTHQCEMC